MTDMIKRLVSILDLSQLQTKTNVSFKHISTSVSLKIHKKLLTRHRISGFIICFGCFMRQTSTVNRLLQ